MRSRKLIPKGTFLLRKMKVKIRSLDIAEVGLMQIGVSRKLRQRWIIVGQRWKTAAVTLSRVHVGSIQPNDSVAPESLRVQGLSPPSCALRKLPLPRAGILRNIAKLLKPVHAFLLAHP